MAYQLKIVIPELPKPINQLNYKHWAIKAKHAKRWKELVSLATVGKRPTNPLTSARLVLTRCSAKEPDFDGLVSSFKHCIDGLIIAKIIIDDKMSVIGQPEYSWEYAPPGKGAVLIEVFECVKKI